MAAFLNILKGIDNTSFEAGRVLWVIGTFAYIVGAMVFQGIAVAKGQTFNMIEFGTGFGGGLSSILLLGGGAISLKDRALAKVKAATE